LVERQTAASWFKKVGGPDFRQRRLPVLKVQFCP